MKRRTCRWSLGLAAVIVIGVSGCGAAPQAAVPAKKTEWIETDKIQTGPILHDKLPDELVARIKRVHATFAEVDGMPIEKWIEDFQRDIDPEASFRVWEDMEVAYKKYVDTRELSLEARKDVYHVVLYRSMASEQDVLPRMKLNQLTVDDAKTIMAGYPAEPKPLDVIRTP
jgi:hypothetical protein